MSACAILPRLVIGALLCVAVATNIPLHAASLDPIVIHSAPGKPING